jgi:hypothetical protein
VVVAVVEAVEQLPLLPLLKFTSLCRQFLHHHGAAADPGVREIVAIVTLVPPVQFLRIVLSFLLIFLLLLTKTLNPSSFCVKISPRLLTRAKHGGCVGRVKEREDLSQAHTTNRPNPCCLKILMLSLHISSFVNFSMRIFGSKSSKRPTGLCISMGFLSRCTQMSSSSSLGLGYL